MMQPIPRALAAPTAAIIAAVAFLSSMAFMTALTGCALLIQEPERAEVVPEGGFAIGGTASMVQGMEADSQNFPPSSTTNLAPTGAVDFSYGAFKQGELAAMALYDGSTYGGSGRLRYQWAGSGGGRLTSVASLGAFGTNYASTSAFTPPAGNSLTSVSGAWVRAYGGELAISTGYKLGDSFSIYAGPKLYYLNMASTYYGLPTYAQNDSYATPAYSGFVGAALKIALGSRLSAVVDLMGTASMAPTSARDSTLQMVPGLALTVLLQTRGNEPSALARAQRQRPSAPGNRSVASPRPPRPPPAAYPDSVTGPAAVAAPVPAQPPSPPTADPIAAPVAPPVAAPVAAPRAAPVPAPRKTLPAYQAPAPFTPPAAAAPYAPPPVAQPAATRPSTAARSYAPAPIATQPREQKRAPTATAAARAAKPKAKSIAKAKPKPARQAPEAPAAPREPAASRPAQPAPRPAAQPASRPEAPAKPSGQGNDSILQMFKD
jgi:hypothetical protein